MPGNPQGHVHIVQWVTVADEAQGLADHIAWLLLQGHSPGEILVLTPRRLLGYAIRDRLQELNVPVHSFYHEEALESDAAQTALTVLTLLANNEDRVALRWWLGYGSPSARKEAYKKIREHCEATGISPWAALNEMEQGTLVIPRTSSLLDRFRELKAIVASVAGGDLAAIVDAVIPDNTEGCDALREAAVLALDQVESIEDLVDALKAVVSQPELPDEGDYVRVMSLHKSKGLTSKVAIVSGCVQGLVPFQDDDQSENEQEAILKEQRRLFCMFGNDSMYRKIDYFVVHSNSKKNGIQDRR